MFSSASKTRGQNILTLNIWAIENFLSFSKLLLVKMKDLSLKIIKCSKHIDKEAAKKEYEILKLVGSSSYFSIVYDCFYLFDEEDNDQDEEE